MSEPEERKSSTLLDQEPAKTYLMDETTNKIEITLKKQ